MEVGEVRSGGKGGMRLFGVTICGGGAAEDAGAGVGEEVMRKSKSMGNLALAEGAAESEAADRGYLSDGGLRKPGKRRRRRAAAAGHERKKGTPWTEEEHRTFLEGLDKLGKGDWRGISRKFVITRTPTQVASHAQKYFIRQSIPSNRKRRSSLFDVVINDTVCSQACISETAPVAPLNEAQKGSNENNLPYLDNKQGCAQVGTLELNSGWVSPPGQERHPSLHFMVDRCGLSGPNSFNCRASASGVVEIEPTSAGPKKSQTLTLMLDAPQSKDNVFFKLHTYQTAPSQEHVQLFPCRPSQANTAHQVTKGNDLDLSIAPPEPLCF